MFLEGNVRASFAFAAGSSGYCDLQQDIVRRWIIGNHSASGRVFRVEVQVQCPVIGISNHFCYGIWPTEHFDTL